MERERDRLAETKQRLLDEYEEKCDKLVASMRDVEAHFESVQDDRERAERERAASEETWRSRVRALEGELEKAREKRGGKGALRGRSREADASDGCARRRDELAEKASGLALEVTRLASENERLGESLARRRGVGRRRRGWRRSGELERERERERERLETERRLRARAESAEAAAEELRRRYAARSLAAARRCGPFGSGRPGESGRPGSGWRRERRPGTNPNGIRRKRRARRRRAWTTVDPGTSNRRRRRTGTNPRRVRSTGSNGSTSRRARCPPRWRLFRIATKPGRRPRVVEEAGAGDAGAGVGRRRRVPASRADARASRQPIRDSRRRGNPGSDRDGREGEEEDQDEEEGLVASTATTSIVVVAVAVVVVVVVVGSQETQESQESAEGAQGQAEGGEEESRTAARDAVVCLASHRVRPNDDRSFTRDVPSGSPPRAREALDAREEEAVARLIRPRSSRAPTEPTPPIADVSTPGILPTPRRGAEAAAARAVRTAAVVPRAVAPEPDAAGRRGAEPVRGALG